MWKWIAGGALAFAILLILAICAKSGMLGNELAEQNAISDIAAPLTVLLAFIAVLVAARSVMYQRQELIETREQAREEGKLNRNVFAEQNAQMAESAAAQATLAAQYKRMADLQEQTLEQTKKVYELQTAEQRHALRSRFEAEFEKSCANIGNRIHATGLKDLLEELALHVHAGVGLNRSLVDPTGDTPNRERFNLLQTKYEGWWAKAYEVFGDAPDWNRFRQEVGMLQGNKSGMGSLAGSWSREMAERWRDNNLESIVHAEMTKLLARASEFKMQDDYEWHQRMRERALNHGQMYVTSAHEQAQQTAAHLATR